MPAAGRGSRLGYDLPKILYPVAGRPVLRWLLDLLGPNCQVVKVVLSPHGKAPVDRYPGAYEVVIQEVPTGMGDAVKLALAGIATVNVVIVWGDQVALRRSSVDACMRLHAGPLQPDITCPTVFREKPYIHFDRNSADQISGMRQAREGDSMPATGESDTGFFCLKTDVLRQLLTERHIGRLTREANFLPVIPLAIRMGYTVLTPHIMILEETVGLNSKEDVIAIEAFLSSRDR